MPEVSLSVKAVAEPVSPGAAEVVIQVSRAKDEKASLDIAKLAGFITGIAFAIGVLYNIGYFLALDYKLLPLLSYKDHLDTLLFFVPYAIVPFFGCIWLRMEPARRTTATVVAGGLAAGVMIAWQEHYGIAWSPAWSAVISNLVYLSAFLLIVYCAAVVLEKILETGDILDANRLYTMGVAEIGVLVFVILLGNVVGNGAARGTWFDIEITLTGESGAKPETRPARLVRAIDGGLLLVFQDAPDKLAYVRNESVRSLAEPLRP